MRYKTVEEACVAYSYGAIKSYPELVDVLNECQDEEFINLYAGAMRLMEPPYYVGRGEA